MESLIVAKSEPTLNGFSASNIWILGKVKPFRASNIDLPVFFKIARPSSTVKEEFFCFIKAHAPVTWGAAMEVPCFQPKTSPGTEE